MSTCICGPSYTVASVGHSSASPQCRALVVYNPRSPATSWGLVLQCPLQHNLLFTGPSAITEVHEGKQD